MASRKEKMIFARTKNISIILLFMCSVIAMRTTAQTGAIKGWGMSACSQHSFSICPGETITPLNYGSQNFACSVTAMPDISFVNQGPGWRVAAHNWTFTSIGSGGQITGIDPSGSPITHVFAAGNILSPSSYVTIGPTDYVIFSLNSLPIAGFTVAANNFSIHLTTTALLVSVNSSTICQGQSATLTASGALTYSWNPGNLSGSTIVVNPMSSTVYTVIGAAGNCTSMAQAAVNVLITPTVSIASTSTLFCSGSSATLTAGGAGSYTWQPSSASGTLLVVSPVVPTNYTLIGASGACASAAVISISVNTTPTLVTPASAYTICSGSPLTLSVSGAGSYTWNPGNHTGPSVTVSPLSATVYTVVGSNGSCTDVKYISVTTNALPSPHISTNGPVCEGSQLLVSISNIGTASVSWKGPSGFIGFTPNVSIPAALVSNSGIYTVVVTDANLCSVSSQVIGSVIPNPILTVSGATACLNGGTLLSASGAANYSWTGPSGEVSNAATYSITKTQSVGSICYTVTGFSANSCSSSQTVALLVVALPSPSISVYPSTTICENSVLKMEGRGGSSYYWRGPNNFYFEGNTFTVIPTNLNYAGNYSLVASNNFGCVNAVSTEIKINKIPFVSLSSNKTEGCSPLTVNFKQQLNGNKGIRASWEIAKQPYSSQTFSYCFNSIGTHLVTGYFTDSLSGCSNTTTFSVKTFPKPQADFTFTPIEYVENNGEILFSNTSQSEQQTDWKWYFLGDKKEYQGHEISYQFNNAGSFPVAMIVKNVWGCQDSVIKVIKVTPDFLIFVPNTFTPNDDGKNEIFMPVTRGIKLYNFSVFDRWGEKLFETSDISIGWSDFIIMNLAKLIPMCGSSVHQGLTEKQKIWWAKYY